MNRSTEAGLLAAATAVPFTLQRSLTSRSRLDQAIVTGLTFTLFQSTVSTVQSALDAVSGRGRDDDWSGSDAAAPLVNAAAVVAGTAVQRALPQRAAEGLPRATARTSGWLVAVSGTAGLVAHAADRLARGDGPLAGRRSAVLTGVAGAVAASRELLRRRLAAADDRDDEDDLGEDAAAGLALGAGVAAAAALLGAAESRASIAVARRLAAVLPGTAERWRPVGHAAVLGGTAASARLAVQRVFAAIEGAQTGVEVALDVPPPQPELSGSPTSLVPYETMSRMGRRFVWTVRTPAEIRRVMQEEPLGHPVRVYGGLALGPTATERVERTLDELERAGGLDRSRLLVASPTGTGYVNYAAVGAMELLSRGDCATVAMQYAARPSPLSLDRVDEGRAQFRLLVDALARRLADRDDQPEVIVFGESLGAWTSQDAFLHEGTDGLAAVGIDRALWIGTPFESKWKDQVLLDDRPDVDPARVGVFNALDEWEALPAARRDQLRYVMVTHHDDGVARFGASLLVQRPDWLGPAAERPAGVPAGERWIPLTTFVQTLIDMKNAARVVPGVFEAIGHDYRADLPGFVRAVLELPATDEQLDRVVAALEAEEAIRARWLADHASVGTGMANDLLDRVRVQAPEAFDAAMAELRSELGGWRDEWEAARAAADDD